MEYSIVSSATRLNVSVVRSLFGSCGAHSSRVVDVVGGVHHQRVLVPARARVAVILGDGARHVRAGADREDARVVNHLGAERDDVRTLRDLEVALIAGASVGRAGADAARAEGEILRAIGRAACLLRGLQRAGPLGRARRERREAAVRRVDDERRAIVEDALGQPALVVVARLRVAGAELRLAVERRQDQFVGEERIAAVHQRLDLLLQVGQLRVGHRRASRELRGALERRHVVVRPHALHVGAAVGHPWHRPVRPRLSGRGLVHRSFSGGGLPIDDDRRRQGDADHDAHHDAMGHVPLLHEGRVSQRQARLTRDYASADDAAAPPLWVMVNAGRLLSLRR